MKVKILASGSKGNCIAVQSGETLILIDAGIPKTKIEQRLMDEGLNPADVSAIFITHAHKDHVQGLPLANKYRIPVFASEGTWKTVQTVDDDLMFAMEAFSTVNIDFEIEVGSFRTHHDDYDAFGFVAQGEDGFGQKVSVCLDTGHVTRDMLEAMQDSDIYIIEANHDPDMVKESDYPASVKTRILSDIGHLSNEQTAAALKRLIKGRGERIYLTHLSSSNNLQILAMMTVRKALRQKGLEAGKHYTLEVC